MFNISIGNCLYKTEKIKVHKAFSLNMQILYYTTFYVAID